MWDALIQYLGKIITVLWFGGAGLMLITIPCCTYKIFSALREDEDPQQEGSVPEKVIQRQYATTAHDSFADSLEF